jgi:hypothetical protein
MAWCSVKTQGQLYHYLKVKEDDVGSTCSTHGTSKKYIQNLKGKNHVEDLGVDGRIIFDWT